MLLLLACSVPSSVPEKPATELCTPAQLGLPDARNVELWKPMDGCHPRNALPQNQAIVVRSEVEFLQIFDCHGQPSEIPYDRKELWVMGYTLSPAGAGTYPVDDGKTLTTIALSRSPCPDSPHAMPIDQSITFLMPVGAQRSFDQKSCTLPATCN